MAKEKYIVQVPFLDLDDKSKEYKAGENYPRPANKRISKERLEQLATLKSTRKHIPFISKVDEPKEVEPETDNQGDEAAE